MQEINHIFSCQLHFLPIYTAAPLLFFANLHFFDFDIFITSRFDIRASACYHLQ